MTQIKAPNDMSVRPANWRLTQHLTAERKAKGITHPNWGEDLPSLGEGWVKNLGKVITSPVIGRCDVVFRGNVYRNREGTEMTWDKEEMEAFRPLPGSKPNPEH